MNRTMRAAMVGAVALLMAAPTAVAHAYPTTAGTFADDDGNTHEGYIEAIAGDDITRGCNPPNNSRYCPGGNVTRGQMAAFIRRAFNLPGTSTDYFGDDDNSIFEGDINALAKAGITKGCNPPNNTRFCPDRSVNRGEMAAFIDRAFGYSSTSKDFFIDDNGSTFENNINAIANQGRSEETAGQGTTPDPLDEPLWSNALTLLVCRLSVGALLYVTPSRTLIGARFN